MKRLLALSGIALLLASCQLTLGPADNGNPNDISGYYSLTSALWSSPVDISNHGTASEDIRHQLLMYGWWGVNTHSDLSGEKSALEASNVLPLPTDGIGQINLFIPFFSYDIVGSTETLLPPTPQDGKCCVSMECINFYYECGEKECITVLPPSVPLQGETFPMTNPTLEVNPGSVVFRANTTLYDFATSNWVDGVLTLRYLRRN
jgi:hypothetical protein